MNNVFNTETIFADRDNYKNVVESLKYNWISNNLIQTGLDTEGYLSENYEDQTIEQKAKLRKILSDNEILITDNHDGEVVIYIQKQKIAEWKKPSFTLKQDLSELNPKKKLYIEIKIEHWSVFDSVPEE